MIKLEDFDLDIVLSISMRVGTIGNTDLSAIDKTSIKYESRSKDIIYYTAKEKSAPNGRINWAWTYRFSLSDYKQKFREKNLDRLV